MTKSCRIKNISTIGGCAKEVATIYRKMRREEMDLNTGKTLVYVLKVLSGLINDSDFEARLNILEAKINAR